ncbi:hypothetical protein [Rheinheimera sp. 1928-s]|uniref:hypothetical protein n=1 Tax=Rheinheimera sp. 1928-s TaxID=3033803 RepID=UPI0026077FE8|nr:hypothetical protein [Rheinheimera sp. 1928-s]MDF3125675.1 hypothetical protein [Rheinheimera sp. 1928-s]
MSEPCLSSGDKLKVPRFGTTISRTLAIPALLLLAATAWYIAPTGLASVWYFKASSSLELWSKQPTLLSLGSWQQASSAIDQAVRLHPKHPHYLLTKAKINEWGWYAGFMTGKELKATEQYYLAAIKTRPNWPNAYADYAYYLAVTQLRLTEAFEQLKLAKRYGPYTPETLLRQLAVGFLRWDSLNPVQKTETLQTLKTVVLTGYPMHSQARILVKETKQQQVACIYLTANKNDFPADIQQRIQKDFCLKGADSTQAL